MAAKVKNISHVLQHFILSMHHTKAVYIFMCIIFFLKSCIFNIWLAYDYITIRKIER